MQNECIMRFSVVPIESKSQIKKAGKILTNAHVSQEEFDWAVELTGRWRACHAYPINTIQSTLRSKLRINNFKDFIVAQRLKRLPTIINKLYRYPQMKLDTMQDIGGIRAILNSIEDVYKLRNEYTESEYFKDLIVDPKDYIASPRDADGYRSLHLIFKYVNKKHPSYNNLRIELQIRTKLQHTWATAVEAMGTFLGQALKARQGDRKWLDFFAITSSAFAYMEKCKPVPRFANLTKNDTFLKVAEMEADMQALEKMRGFSIAVDQIHKQKGKGSSYYLVILDSLNHKVTITPYDRDSFEKANQDYSEIELQVTKGEKIEPVLVSSGSIDSLKKAYPNFFLDTSAFTQVLSQILKESEKANR